MFDNTNNDNFTITEGIAAADSLKTHVARAKNAGVFYDSSDPESGKHLEVIMGSHWEEAENKHTHYLGFRKNGNDSQSPYVMISFNCRGYHGFVDDLASLDGLREPDLMSLLDILFDTDTDPTSQN